MFLLVVMTQKIAEGTLKVIISIMDLGVFFCHYCDTYDEVKEIYKHFFGANSAAFISLSQH